MHQSAPHQARRGFTLVELLVVIGIIALLISILMPALTKARQQAVGLKCLNNIRQLTVVNQMYANGYKQIQVFCNWGDTQWYDNAKIGWLFEVPLNGPLPEKVETGHFWQYLANRESYRCPTHVKGDSGTFGAAKSDALTSYLMNGATCGYGTKQPPTSNRIVFFKLGKFKSDDILFWEADERGGAAWNDGSSYPGESFNPTDPKASGLTSRHGKVATIACFDGHAEWISHQEFRKLAIDTKRNKIYCNPLTGDGHP